MAWVKRNDIDTLIILIKIHRGYPAQIIVHFLITLVVDILIGIT